MLNKLYSLPTRLPIGGASVTSFYSLGISKTAPIKLLQNIGVSGNVAFNNNNIDT